MMHFLAPWLGARKKSFFLSYPHEYAAIARVVAKVLRSQGHDVFVDQDDLICGERFQPRIKSEIWNRDVFILLAGPEATSSPWVQWELSEALAWEEAGGCQVVTVWVGGGARIDVARSLGPVFDRHFG